MTGLGRDLIIQPVLASLPYTQTCTKCCFRYAVIISHHYDSCCSPFWDVYNRSTQLLVFSVTLYCPAHGCLLTSMACSLTMLIISLSVVCFAITTSFSAVLL